MSSDDLKAVTTVGNTALTYAVATVNVNIAKVMQDKNRDLEKLCSGVRPLFMATVLRHSQMLQFLYSWRKVSQWCGNEQDEQFITCVKGDLYDEEREEDNKEEDVRALALDLHFGFHR
ncbi:hypothetical protein CFP56_000525 [Quercus suber]|uniref:Uncharacterized protein n=1 Tax=Quercus suber TaxID=58331 RepID=A0AAW0LJD5_QUESU